MTELRTAHTAELDAGAKSAIRSFLYAARGWQRWRGPASAMTPDGIIRTPGTDGIIYVLPVSVPLDVSAELICDWRPGSLW